MPVPRRHPLACIVPPDLLRDVIRNGTEEERDAAADTMAVDQTFRTLRAAFAATVAANRVAMRPMGGMGGQPQRTIYDQGNSNAMALGMVARTEGQKRVRDPAVNEAYDGFGATYTFFWEGSAATRSTAPACRSSGSCTTRPTMRTRSGTARATCSSATVTASSSSA